MNQIPHKPTNAWRRLAMLLMLATVGAVVCTSASCRRQKDNDSSPAADRPQPHPAVTTAPQVDPQSNRETRNPDDPADMIDPMIALLADGKEELVRDRLRGNPDVNRKSVNRAAAGKTLLHLAIDRGHVELVRVLLQCGARSGAIDNAGMTALDAAAAQQPANPDLISLLLSVDAEGDARSTYRALATAVAAGLQDVARGYIARMVNIDGKRDDKGNGLVHFAAKEGNAEVMQLLVERNVSLSITDWEGSAPLHMAAVAKQHAAEVIAVLLAGKANVNQEDLFDREPLYLACQAGASPAVLRALLDRGAKVNSRGDRGMVPLLLAASRLDKDAIKLLLEYKADVNIQDHEGKTALHYAALAGDKELVEMLLTAKAGTRIRDNSRMLARVYASQKGYPEINELILRVEADRAAAAATQPVQK